MLLLFQSLGIQVVLTILLITCTVSFSIRLVDLNKVYKDFGSYSLPGSTLALIFGAEVSELYFLLLVSSQKIVVFQSCDM